MQINTPHEAALDLVRRRQSGPRKDLMAVIDYARCGVNDIIGHSLEVHPQLLAERIRFHARVHAQFADAYDNREVTRSELDLADRLHAFAAAIESGDCTIPDEIDVRRAACGVRRAAFSCAARLQDLNPIMQNVIIAREDAPGARRAGSG